LTLRASGGDTPAMVTTFIDFNARWWWRNPLEEWALVA
jgi:hypothetical protein